jgi:hypothetical protein
MSDFISGALMLGYLAAGLYFLRFWRATCDRLFAFFACAFWLLALQRLALALTTTEGAITSSTAPPPPIETQTLLYLVRLFAFVLILIAIIDKNSTRSRRDG